MFFKECFMFGEIEEYARGKIKNEVSSTLRFFADVCIKVAN